MTKHERRMQGAWMVQWRVRKPKSSWVKAPWMLPNVIGYATRKAARAAAREWPRDDFEYRAVYYLPASEDAK